jgi:cyclohexyl-isocyanide hydratase
MATGSIDNLGLSIVEKNMASKLRFGFLVFPNLQQLDLAGPYEMFSVLDVAKEVPLVWKSREPVLSTTGISFTPTCSFADCPKLDLICVPGGVGVNALLRDEAVLAFVRQQAASARFVTSVCTGALVLGAAGLLAGKRATSHWSARDLLAGFGAIPTLGRVVRDGRLITAGGVTAGIDFALTAIAELCGIEAAQRCQLQLEYAPEPPFDAGTPESAPAEILATLKERGSAVRREREAIIAEIGMDRGR